MVGNNVYAEDVLVLQKGDAAPYTGLLFPQDKANEARIGIIERDSYKSLYDSARRQISLFQTDSELKDKKIDLLLAQNDKLAVNLERARDTSDWMKLAYVGLGIVITGLAIKGAKEITH